MGVVMWSIVWGGNIAKRRGTLDGKGHCGADQVVSFLQQACSKWKRGTKRNSSISVREKGWEICSCAARRLFSAFDMHQFGFSLELASVQLR